MKTWDTNRVHLNKQNLIILHWVKFLIGDWLKKTKKKGFFKRLKNIQDKNKELLKASSIVNKDQAAKNGSDFNYDTNYAFYKFYSDMASLDLKHSELNKFNELLSNFDDFVPLCGERKEYKIEVLNNTNSLYNKYFNTYKRKYNREHLNKRDEIFFDPNQFRILGKKKQKSKSEVE